MKNKKGSGGGKGRKRLTVDKDPFFTSESKKRRKQSEADNIESSGESDDDFVDRNGGAEEAEDSVKETADEARKRLASVYLEKLRKIGKKEDEEDGGDNEEDEEQLDKDSRLSQFLLQHQLQESGRQRRALACRVQEPENADGFRLLEKHRQSVTAVVLSEDDLKGFSASKDGTIMHWDVDSGKAEKYQWPTDQVLRSHGAKDPQGPATKHSKQVLALAVSSDGRYLASGGLDRHVHLWDVRTRQHVQAFPGHRGPVSCLTFRQGTSELFSGSYDRTVKIWNADDRAYINTLFGHQSEVLNIDCLRKERVLTVGRDRSMQLFKVPEESRLVFRAPASSLECCGLVNNDEFLSGSDDGSIELWSVIRKKPVCIVKNAHASLTANKNFEPKCSDKLCNGHLENGDLTSEKYASSSAYSWVSSISICRNSDLVASGAGNGYVRLWAVESEAKDIRPLFNLPLVGFVNSLVFAKSGEFLVAGVGQEPRLGRWGRIPAARNGIAIHPLKLS